MRCAAPSPSIPKVVGGWRYAAEWTHGPYDEHSRRKLRLGVFTYIYYYIYYAMLNRAEGRGLNNQTALGAALKKQKSSLRLAAPPTEKLFETK